MRILHTSDWHIGRTFHGHSTLAALEQVLDALVAEVRARGVQVVLAAGDIFDSSTPSADAVELLDDVLAGLRGAGAQVVLTSGNHDSPARLGAKAAFARHAGIHVLTRCDELASPVTLADEHGEVHFYGVPYLEPVRQRTAWADAASMRSQRDALDYAMALIRADAADRQGRTVVLAHTFVQGAEGESCDSEQRDIVGGVDKVPVSTFDGIDYAALGHIHGRMRLAGNVRYSGAPLHFSFAEAAKPRGGWLVDLDADGLAGVEWVDLPVPRPLSVLTGTLDGLLAEPAHEAVAGHWISAILTDNTRPMDAMRRLQRRFPWCATLEFRPSVVATDSAHTYAELVRGRSDQELIDGFLAKVRNGEGATGDEAELIGDVVAEYTNRKVLA
jgi:exonuclease SbcD